AQDKLIRIMEEEGYVHQGFTRGYSKTSQARWMSVLDVGGYDDVNALVKTFDSQRKRNIKKAQKFGVKVRFLEVDEMDKFMKLYLATSRSEEHTSELQSRFDLVCRLLLEKKNN